MKNIFRIFVKDMKGLVRNPLALIIAIGICLLPSLYAWFSIYSNWDPYSSTNNIKIAIYSADKGVKDSDGLYKNLGDDVVNELKSNKAIGWTQVASPLEAEKGVESGQYYAAVVISEQFSDALYNGAFTSFKDNPTITYYENQKKNAVATKITDTAVDSLKANINHKFLNVAITSIFHESNGISSQFSDGKDISIKDQVSKLSNDLTQYSDIISSIIKSNGELTTTLKEAQNQAHGMEGSVSDAAGSFDSTKDKLNDTKTSLQGFDKNVNTTLSQLEASLRKISDEIEKAKLSDSADELEKNISNILKDTSAASKDIDTLRKSLTDTENASINSLNNQNNKKGISDQIKAVKDIYDKPIDTLDFLSNGLDKIDTSLSGQSAKQVANMTKEMTQSLNSAADSVAGLRNTYTNSLVPQMKNVLDSLSTALSSATNMLNSLGGAVKSLSNVFSTAGTAISSSNDSLEQIKSVVDGINNKIKDFQTRFNNVSAEEYSQNFIDFMSGDPEQYGNYLASPVEIQTEKIYPVDYYGSAMTPFYSVLAIWVGITILVSILKVRIDPEGLVNPKPYQLYFGRFLTFLVLSLFQTIVIVLGDIFILHCQILYPWLFLVAALVTSLTFTLFIYSLTISFGDIGKAIAVIAMVIQISGSSGTFPIELLPSLYRTIYIFFPFPYAIDAMRETIGGLYQMKFITSLSQLLIFGAVGLIIGLVVRIPFVKINHYMEKRMEDTKMM